MGDRTPLPRPRRFQALFAFGSHPVMASRRRWSRRQGGADPRHRPSRPSCSRPCRGSTLPEHCRPFYGHLQQFRVGPDLATRQLSKGVWLAGAPGQRGGSCTRQNEESPRKASSLVFAGRVGTRRERRCCCRGSQLAWAQAAQLRPAWPPWISCRRCRRRHPQRLHAELGPGERPGKIRRKLRT